MTWRASLHEPTTCGRQLCIYQQPPRIRHIVSNMNIIQPQNSVRYLLILFARARAIRDSISDQSSKSAPPHVCAHIDPHEQTSHTAPHPTKTLFCKNMYAKKKRAANQGSSVLGGFWGFCGPKRSQTRESWRDRFWFDLVRVYSRFVHSNYDHISWRTYETRVRIYGCSIN